MEKDMKYVRGRDPWARSWTENKCGSWPDGDGLYSGSLIWDEDEWNGDDFWDFHAVFSNRFSNDYELTYLKIQKDVNNEIIMEADNAENCINSITFDYYK